MDSVNKLFTNMILSKPDHINHRYIIRHLRFGTCVISGNYKIVKSILDSDEVIDFQVYYVIEG